MDTLGLLGWLLPVTAAGVICAYLIRSDGEKGWKDLRSRLQARVQGRFAELLLVLTLLGGLLPGGMLIWLLPIMVPTFIRSEDRTAWRGRIKPRATLVSIWLVAVLAMATIPPPAPASGDDWGSPLSTENPNAPIWPANAQHIWLLTDPDLAIVSVSTTRLPGVIQPMGAASLTEYAISVTGADDARLQQAIQRAKDSPAFAVSTLLDPEDFGLVEIPSEGQHRYVSTSLGVDEELVATRHHVTWDAVIPGTEVLEILTVHKAEWGGAVHSLSVIRSIGHKGEPWAEPIVLEWLAEQ